MLNWKRARSNVLLLLAALCLCLILFEVFLRATGLGWPNPMRLYADTAPVGKPHAVWTNYVENKNRVEHNNLGFHDRDRSESTVAYRFVFVGDSFLQGVHIPTEKLYTTLLEKRLVAKNYDVEIMNAGVSGTGTADQYLLWKTLLKDRIKHHHIVLCMFVGNDLELQSMGSSDDYAAIFDADGTLRFSRRRYSPVQASVRSMTSHSAVMHLLYERLYLVKAAVARRKVADRTAVSPKATPPSRYKEWEQTVTGLLRFIRKWKEEAEQQGLGFSVMVIERPLLGPAEALGDQFRVKFVQNLAAQCAAEKTRFLKYSPGRHAPSEVYFREGAGHLNELGHQLAADQLFEWILTDPPQGVQPRTAPATPAR